MNNSQQVFAIVRVDLADLKFLPDEIRSIIKVKAIVSSMDEAAKEVERLNALNQSKGSVYFWQATRLIAPE
jgi:hypothetical protein